MRYVCRCCPAELCFREVSKSRVKAAVAQIDGVRERNSANRILTHISKQVVRYMLSLPGILLWSSPLHAPRRCLNDDSHYKPLGALMVKNEHHETWRRIAHMPNFTRNAHRNPCAKRP